MTLDFLLDAESRIELPFSVDGLKSFNIFAVSYVDFNEGSTQSYFVARDQIRKFLSSGDDLVFSQVMPDFSDGEAYLEISRSSSCMDNKDLPALWVYKTKKNLENRGSVTVNNCPIGYLH